MTNHKHRQSATPPTIICEPEPELEPEQHTLTYPAKVDPPVGWLLGPSRNGRKVWRVLGSVWDAAKGKTYVTVEEYRPQEEA